MPESVINSKQTTTPSTTPASKEPVPTTTTSATTTAPTSTTSTTAPAPITTTTTTAPAPITTTTSAPITTTTSAPASVSVTGNGLATTGGYTLEFNLICFSTNSTRVGLVGSSKQLGLWNATSCVPLTRNVKAPVGTAVVNFDLKPSYWTGSVSVDSLEEISNWEYKFIIWNDSDRPTSNDVQWESKLNTQSGNRIVSFDKNFIRPHDNDHLHHRVTLGSHHVTDKVAKIPPTNFLVSETITEYIQTTQYFRSVVAANDIDYNKVCKRIVLGSSPRTPAHLDQLKRDGCIAILNLQTEEDVLKHGPLHGTPEKNTCENYRKLVSEKDIALVWIPTTDMCTEGRASMVAQSAWIILGLLMSHDTGSIYIHCNAGVGRSTAATMAFLIYIKQLSFEAAHEFISSQRPVIFFDKLAMMQGQKDFDSKFGSFAREIIQAEESKKTGRLDI